MICRYKMRKIKTTHHSQFHLTLALASARRANIGTRYKIKCQHIFIYQIGWNVWMKQKEGTPLSLYYIYIRYVFFSLSFLSLFFLRPLYIFFFTLHTIKTFTLPIFNRITEHVNYIYFIFRFNLPYTQLYMEIRIS